MEIVNTTTQVGFHDIDSVDKKLLKYVVICAEWKGCLIWVRHKDRMTWEIPGGHIEFGENAWEAACRELVEETGASEYSLSRVCVYSVTRNGTTSFGMLCFAKVEAYKVTGEYEIEEARVFVDIPNNLTYPDIQPHLLDRISVWKTKLAAEKKISICNIVALVAVCIIPFFYLCWQTLD
jgi:8-oxo-dGTP diphosphatase